MTWYRTGTVTVTNGSAAVTGAGTAFVASVRAGYGFVGPDGRTYEVSAVNSDTQVTLAAAYQGATAAGQAYAIFPTQSVIADLADQASELIDSFVDVRDGVGAGLNPDGSAATPAIRFSADQDTGIYRLGANSFGFALGGAAVAWFNDDGSFQIAAGGAVRDLTVRHSGTGTDSLTLANTSWDRRLSFRALSNGYGIFSRNWSDGSAKELHFGTGDTELLNLDVSGNLVPLTDNTQALGWPSSRWSTVYAGTGTINTSDERDKTWRGELSAAEYEAGLEVLGEVGFYQFDDAIADKGADGARFHFGVRAQRVWAIFATHGLVEPIVGGKPGATPYSFLCFDEWQEERRDVVGPNGEPTGETEQVRAAGDRYGIRPDELALFLLAVQARRQGELEARIAALETA